MSGEKQVRRIPLKEAMTVAQDLLVTGGFRGQMTVVSKTANYTVVSADSASYFNNSGTSGAVTNTLPTAAGLHYYSYVDARRSWM